MDGLAWIHASYCTEMRRAADLDAICETAERWARAADAHDIGAWDLVVALLRTRCAGQLLFEYAYPECTCKMPLAAATRSVTCEAGIAVGWSTDALGLLSSTEEHARKLGLSDADSACLAVAALCRPCRELIAFLNNQTLTPQHAVGGDDWICSGVMVLLPRAPDVPLARKLTIFEIPEPYRSDEEVRACIDMDGLWPEAEFQKTEIVRVARRLRPHRYSATCRMHGAMVPAMG